MKNEKIIKVLDVVIQVCNIAVIIAQTLKTAFPSGNRTIEDEEARMVKDFLSKEIGK